MINEDQDVSVFGELLVFILFGVLFGLFMLVIIIFKIFGSQKIKLRIQKKREALYKKMVWNGLINSIKISYFKNCITIGNQMRLLVLGSRFLKSGDVITAGVMFTFYAALTCVVTKFLWTNYEVFS